MKIALLGAGHIGQTIARLLHASGDYRVTVLDQDERHLAVLAAEGISTAAVDGGDRVALAGRLRGQDAVVNALPYHLAVGAAELARECGCHYFDLTEDVAATRAIKALAEDAPTAFMPQCGLAPGFIGIVAHHLAKGFDSVRDVQMRVGALPAFPTNALKYNLTWSVDGLINEYCHPCEAIHGGELIQALPKRLARKSGRSTCSWRMKPRCGSLPLRNRSTAAQTPAAVVIWIADSGERASRSAKILRANTSCSSTPFFCPLTVTNTSTTSCIVAGMLRRMIDFRFSGSLLRPRSPSRNCIRSRWPG